MAEIKTSAFCGLSRSADWQNWLKETAPDLHKDLMKVVGASKGCRANSNKMMDVYFELNKRKLEPELIVFLRRRFPWIIKENSSPIKAKQDKEKAQKANTAHQVKNARASKDWEVLNKHKVFASYRPDILSFPQKFIIVDQPAALYDRVQRFVENKLAVDYLIVGDRAYIEYFEPKYAAIIDKIPRSSRDIYKYRLKMQQKHAK
jgi:hypothetical protein